MVLLNLIIPSPTKADITKAVACSANSIIRAVCLLGYGFLKEYHIIGWNYIYFCDVIGYAIKQSSISTAIYPFSEAAYPVQGHGECRAYPRG